MLVAALLAKLVTGGVTLALLITVNNVGGFEEAIVLSTVGLLVGGYARLGQDSLIIEKVFRASIGARSMASHFILFFCICTMCSLVVSAIWNFAPMPVFFLAIFFLSSGVLAAILTGLGFVLSGILLRGLPPPVLMLGLRFEESVTLVIAASLGFLMPLLGVWLLKKKRLVSGVDGIERRSGPFATKVKSFLADAVTNLYPHVPIIAQPILQPALAVEIVYTIMRLSSIGASFASVMYWTRTTLFSRAASVVIFIAAVLAEGVVNQMAAWSTFGSVVSGVCMGLALAVLGSARVSDLMRMDYAVIVKDGVCLLAAVLIGFALLVPASAVSTAVLVRLVTCRAVSKDRSMDPNAVQDDSCD